MEQVSLLFYLAKPQSGAFCGVTYVIVRQNHSISDVLLKLAERTERTHSTLRGHVAVVAPTQNVATAFIFKHKKTIDVSDLSSSKTIRYLF